METNLVGHNVCNFLNGTSGDNWCGWQGQILWPSNSSDLTLNYFFLQDNVKDTVYGQGPHSLLNLHQPIAVVFASVTQNMTGNTRWELVHCCLCNSDQWKMSDSSI
jgi:hypothetical protein